MTTRKHIVQIHLVENSKVDLAKAKMEKEFDTKSDAQAWVKYYNNLGVDLRKSSVARIVKR